VLGRGRTKRAVDHPGLHGRGQPVGVDLHGAGHPLHAEDHAARERVGAARQAGARATRHDREAVGCGGAHGGLDLRGGPRPHEHGGLGDREQARRGLVARVGGHHPGIGDDVAGAGEIGQERAARGRRAHPRLRS
jgi:hypothetical protein